MDGWLHNDAQPRANPLEPALPLPGATNNKKTPAARSIAVRGTVEYKPTSDFSASLKLLYSDYRDNELSGQVQAPYRNGWRSIGCAKHRPGDQGGNPEDRKSTRLNSSH